MQKAKNRLLFLGSQGKLIGAHACCVVSLEPMFGVLVGYLACLPTVLHQTLLSISIQHASPLIGGLKDDLNCDMRMDVKSFESICIYNYTF